MPEPQPNADEDATVAHPADFESQPAPTHSSFGPQQQTSPGETKSVGVGGTVVDVGSQLGPYQLLDKLGEGGMGAVYKARHTKLGRLVALKVLPPHVLSRPDALSRFEREMKAVGTLSHPNVVQALDAGDFGGVHYLSMEYVEGQDLQELVKSKGPMSVVNACKAIRQAALGLAAAHKLGLVHRDIKPSNLFVTKETGQIKILDMGLALLSEEQTPAALTSTGQCFGTPDYMAPEQWEDAHTCDARADLYALGCTLFLLLVGRTPYGGDEYRTVPRKMMGHVRDPIPDLKAARRTAVGWTPSSDRSSSSSPVTTNEETANEKKRTDEGVHPTSDIPDGLDAIYRKLMAKEPKDRFASADQLADALAPFTRQGGTAQGRSALGSPVAPRQEARTQIDSPKRPGSDAAAPPSNASPAARIVSRSETATLGEAPVDPLGATSTWSPDQAPPASHPSGTVPPRGPHRKWLLTSGGAAALVLLLGVIIIKITNKDGTVTEIKVPEGAKVEITNDGKMAAPGRPSDADPNPKKTAEGGHPTKAPGWHGWPADAPPPAIAPFDAEQAQHHQEAWAKYLGVPVEYTNSLGMKFRLIPPGEFTMGSTKEEIDNALTALREDKEWLEYIKSEAPQHKVVLTQPTFLGIHEVTQADYEHVTGKNPSYFVATGPEKQWSDKIAGMNTIDHPVETVTWNDAAEFCAKLSEQEKLKPFYFRTGETVTPLEGIGYRLPTEAEWEFSCRAGTTTKFWIGDKDQDLVRAGWFGTTSGNRTHTAGELKANPFGLYDTHGNIWEWVQDWWEPSYYGQFQGKPATNPSGSSSAGSSRVLRGGVWHHTASFCRASSRFAYNPSASYKGSFGFRALLTVAAVRQSLKLTGLALPNRPKASVTDGSTSSTAKPLTPLPPLDLDETDPLPGWELPAGAPPPVVAPCEPTLATERQQLWAEFLKRPVIEENAATKLKFALIPPGEFRKIFTRPRDPAIEPDMPVRRFRLTKPYALSTTEVTWDQFRQFVEATGYQTEAETNGLGGRDREFKPDPKINWRTPGWKPAPNEPVTQVTPRDAEAFCEWLTDPVGWASSPSVPSPLDKKEDAKKEKKKDGLEAHPTVIYRLPTEAEWVHACRAGSVHKHVVGPEPGDLADYAWTQESLDPNPQASPLHLVAQKKPNPFGLHDTLGNVYEYTGQYIFSRALIPYLPTNDPTGLRSLSAVGLSWSEVRSDAHPDYIFPSYHYGASPTIGFRVLKQFAGEPLPGPLDRPLVLRAGQPLSVHALVPRPEKIPGLQSWSIELASSHTDVLRAIAASPKGDIIATGSNITGKISLWDRDGNYQRALLGHEASVTSLDFSPDGRWLASCEQGGGTKGFGGITARVWNVETGALHAVIPFSNWAQKVAFSPDSERLAIAGEFNALLVLDLRTGQTLSHTTRVEGGEPRSVAWSPNGTELACSYGGNHLRVRDAKTLQVLREVEAPPSGSLEWSPDGQWLAMRGSDGKVAIRDAKTMEVTKTFSMSAHALAWLLDSQRLAASAGDQSGVFDTATGERLAKFNAGNSPISLLDEGKQAVFEHAGRLHFYDTSTGQKLREGKERGQILVDFFPPMLAPNTGEIFSTNPFLKELRVFDAATGDQQRRFSLAGTEAWFPSPAPDGSTLALTWPDLAFGFLLDAKTGTKRHELSPGRGNVTRVAWSADGKWLATGATDKLVRVWNVATGKIEHELAGHTGTIWSLAWSPDGIRLASAAEDKTVRLWNPLAGKLVTTYDQFPEAMKADEQDKLAWTTDSRRLWIALSQHIVPLDVETGTFGPLENFSNGNVVTFLNTSPDGQRLLVREGYGWTFVRGRDAQDRRLLGQHLGQTAQWHPDSRRFLGWEPSYGTVGFDVETNRRLGLLFPWLTGEHWLCLGPTGHYRGSPGVEDQFVYVAMLPDGSQRTYTPAEFAAAFNWKNDPERAELLGK